MDDLRFLPRFQQYFSCIRTSARSVSDNESLSALESLLQLKRAPHSGGLKLETTIILEPSQACFQIQFSKIHRNVTENRSSLRPWGTVGFRGLL